MPKECFNLAAILVSTAAFYAVMLDLCENRPSCVVRASPETFTQDPCLGTSKYLEAHYKCRPNEFERRTACEGERLHISCGRGDRIAVYSAMFGRTPNGTDRCRANNQEYIDCQATGALSEVNSHCLGRRSCGILAGESVFGNPCVGGVHKYLTVSYACVPQKILKRQHRKANNKKRKKKKKKKDDDEENAANGTTETDPASKNSNFLSVEEGNSKRLGTTTTNINKKKVDEGIVNSEDSSNDIRAFTDSSVSTLKSNKDMSADYNTKDNYGNSIQNHGNTDNSLSDTKNSNNHRAQIRDNNSESMQNSLPFNTTLNSASRNKTKGPLLKPNTDSTQTSISKSAIGNSVSGSYVTERNLTVLCMNYTREDVRWGGMVRPKDERTIGFLRDWFSALYYLQTNQEKAWLYFTLGICFGIIVMLIVVLIKVCVNFRRNIRARLDVSEPTHRSTHTNNHSSLDAPMLEHSDSMDRIEVVRFSPRNTLRGQRSNSHHRDLVNYYG